MLSIEKLIGIASERDASDVHLIAGLPPKCRIDGRITDLYGEPLTPMDCEQYGESLAGEEITSQLIPAAGQALCSVKTPAGRDPKALGAWTPPGSRSVLKME